MARPKGMPLHYLRNRAWHQIRSRLIDTARLNRRRGLIEQAQLLEDFHAEMMACGAALTSDRTATIETAKYLWGYAQHVERRAYQLAVTPDAMSARLELVGLVGLLAQVVKRAIGDRASAKLLPWANDFPAHPRAVEVALAARLADPLAMTDLEEDADEDAPWSPPMPGELRETTRLKIAKTRLNRAASTTCTATSARARTLPSIPPRDGLIETFNPRVNSNVPEET